MGRFALALDVARYAWRLAQHDSKYTQEVREDRSHWAQGAIIYQ